MFQPPSRRVDRIYWRLIQFQKCAVVGHLVRQLLLMRGIDIPPKTLSPGRGLILRHSGNVVVHGWTRIGNNVMLHQGVTIGRADIWRPPSSDFEGFVLEDNVILGANSVVTASRGTLIVGEGTVLGANSTLTRSTGSWEIWAGSPAKLVGKRMPN